MSVENVSDALQELQVAVDDEIALAICYPALTGVCNPGDEVLLNTTAVDLGLGTGGAHFVVARAARPGTANVVDRSSGGHIMKLRYTPLQLDVVAVEEQASGSHEIMAHAVDAAGMPVACCGLHSQVPLVAAAVKSLDSSLSVAYVMTDFAALPLALSRIVRESVAAGLIDTTISSGQAFGGMYEAVNVHSALLAAKHVVGADVAIVGIGPGVVGTATPFGHGGVAQGEAINAATAVGARPVAALRVSFADDRERHRGVSHHTLTALASVALGRALVAVPSPPAGLELEFSRIEEALTRAGIWKRHARFDAGPLVPDLGGVTVKSMSRCAEQDPAFFAAAYAAGQACAALIAGTATL